MIIELYTTGSEHPAIYDAYIDKEGNLYGMNPPPPELSDMMQVVIERDGDKPNKDQFGCLNFLYQINGCTAVYLWLARKEPTLMKLLPSK
ncbi:hypothetical protein [Rhizobium phaseoli]|uniref:hypothetical protein n=1 Tax=Rhizobium phaseoli TaxID=396 RepID=UPI0007EAE3BC|nr:hypothetical protein [Rhizobium phaseoli]